MDALLISLLFFASFCSLSTAQLDFVSDTIEVDVNVCEDALSGTEIYTIEATGGTEPYSYFINTPEFLSYGSVNENGTISLDRQIDFEQVKLITVTVQVVDASDFPQTIEGYIRVVIDDANDNAPVFQSSSYSVEVYEYPWSNDTLLTIEASDRDKRGLQDVTLRVKNSSYAHMEGNNLVLNSSAQLDYETLPVIQVEIVAEDDGSFGCQSDKTPLTETTTVLIRILDGPDQNPLFFNTFAELEENSAIGAEVATVTAQDQDYTLNWKMEYSIVEGGLAENRFSINPTTGVITVNENIDRETVILTNNQGTVEFTVTATEIPKWPFSSSDCNGACTATATVTVNILDVNDNGPTFYAIDPSGTSSKVSQSSFSTEMDENTAKSISVPGLSIYVQDTDAGDNATFSLTISGPEADVFEVSPETVNAEASVVLRVKDSTALDYESVRSFNVQIVAEETLTSEKRSSTATVSIQLRDTNDHSPEFSRTEFEADIEENSPVGSVVTIVNATDDDIEEQFKNITYALKPDSINSTFNIDPFTGTITLVGDLNREQTDLYYFTVTATDGGGRTASSNVQVTVTDVNDNSPAFLRSSYAATVKENESNFSTPLEIIASDDDQADTPNSEIVYGISYSDIPDQFFVETSDTSGEVKLNSPIDMESLNSSLLMCSDGAIKIKVDFIATDGGSPPLSDTVAAFITIEDDNDHAPKFVNTSYSGSVPEKSLAGTAIMSVSATDDDACSPNSDIIYQLSTDDATNINAFSIGSLTGEITVRDSNLDRDEVPSYNIEVFAIDSGTNRNTGTTTVTVTLTDVNDKPPVFITDNFNLDVFENLTVESEILTVSADDDDSDSNLSYSLTDVQCYDERFIEVTDGCSNLFNLTKTVPTDQNVKLVIADELDRETIEQYRAVISVEDLNADKRFSSQKITAPLIVTVLDSNDNLPQFDVITADYEVNEEVVNAVIGQVIASDVDKGVNGDVTYSVASGNEEWVSIEPDNGRLTTNKSIDRETFGDWLNITVTATDGGSPPLNSTLDIPIRILDINDNDPEFSMSVYTANVSEDASKGTVVTRVYATDDDVGTFASLFYTIILGGELGQFDINSTTGEISVASGLDRERWPSYTLTVRATDNDGASNGNQQTASVEITVLDVNDEAPQFSSTMYTVNFREDSEVGEVVTTLTATDEDEEGTANVVIEYSIISGNEQGHFVINSSTGVVSLSSSIRNGEEEYDIQVQAKNPGMENKNHTCLLTIDVIDVNINDPVFQNLPPTEQVAVEENQNRGTFVFQVNATDRDRGDNGKIVYELTEGGNDFAIDNFDGTITTTRSFDREATEGSSYEVTVKASDSDFTSGRRSASQTFTINILDVDDNLPFYDSADNEQTMSMLEETEPGPLSDPIQKASDADTADNSINYYFIVGGSGMDHFSLSSSTRVLSTLNTLDREATAQYDLVIKASNDPDYTSNNPPVVDWETVRNDDSFLHVIVDLEDANDNVPQFSTDRYLADIPYNTQPGTENIIVQVYASDGDIGDNAKVTYVILETYWILNGQRNPDEDTFAITPSRDDVRGDVYLNGPIKDNENGHYEITVQASDINPAHTDKTLVWVGIVKKDETVILYSRMTPTEFEEVRDPFTEDLGALLNAEVFIDGVIGQTASEVDTAQSAITVHAKELNSTTLIPKETISNTLSRQENFDFLNTYDITRVGSVSEAPPDRTAENLTIGLIIAVAVVLIVAAVFTTAIVCIRRKYDRKLTVLRASESASKDVRNMSSSNGRPRNGVVPGSNQYNNSENPLYAANNNQTIDLEGWYGNEESYDDDDVDDNAVDSQDSAINVNVPDEKLEDDQFQIDFDEGDQARLAAALNAANRRNGADNLTFLFDDDTTL